MIEMQLVERHIIDRYDQRFVAIDEACWLSKNLYNRANYILRQHFIDKQGYIPYVEMAKRMKSEPDYQALLASASRELSRSLTLTQIQISEIWAKYAHIYRPGHQ